MINLESKKSFYGREKNGDEFAFKAKKWKNSKKNCVSRYRKTLSEESKIEMQKTNAIWQNPLMLRSIFGKQFN